MMDCGLRVVRGPNWCWENQDGGEGYVGTVCEIPQKSTSDKIVVVQWDNGNRTNCRVGHLGKFDLRIIDNAQIGAKHRAICDGCEKNIAGIRYKCISCFDYDLCYMCYHGDKHDVTHPFKRFDYALWMGVNLPPRLIARRCELKGVFEGARVVRGYNWEWGNQDGGEGKTGIVMDIRDWDSVRSRSVADVKWLFGNTDVYRLGHKGNCDIKFIEPSSGGYYYPEHLPILGQSEEDMELNQVLDAIDLQQIMQLENEGMVEQKEECEQEPNPVLASLDPVGSMYASVIIKYSQAINQGTPQLNLLNEFSRLSNEFKNNEVKDMWEIIKYMVQLPSIPQSADIIKERNSNNFIKALITQANKYLEDKYKAYMIRVVNENILEVPFDDATGIYPLVHSFVGIRFKGEYLGFEDGTINDRPLWPLVYYCLRLGDISAAIQCLRKNYLHEHRDIIFILELKLKDPDHPDIDMLEENIRISYRTTIRNCTDPFKRITWAILGCYDEISEVARTEDDHLWFKLNLMNCDGKGSLSYGELQHTVLEEHGETHYDAVNHPYLYFKLLTLTGQFEAAIDFLFRTEKFKEHGVHIAITLNELNLLALPQDVNSSLISSDRLDTKPARRLNFALLVKSYTGKFTPGCLVEALHYLFLLRNISDLEGQNLFEAYISDLTIQTKQYAEILGKIQKNGTKTKGLIDEFTNSKITAESIAQILVEQKKWEEAFELYNIVNMHEGVIRLMCRMLSKVAHLESRPDSVRNKVLEIAIVVDDQFSLEGYNTSKNMVSSFFKLKGLLTFFDQYRAKEYPEALKTLIGLKIVPLKFNELEERIRNFDDWNEDLREIIPDVLLATMAILLAQCDRIKKTEGPMEKHLECVWEQANCITNFTERLQSKIAGATLNRLIQMEILMHS